MNSSLLQSKKFRAASMAAIASILAFCVSEFGLKLDVEKTIALISTIMLPILIYIGAEGVSEAPAKAVVEEEKGRKDLNDLVLNKIEQSIKDNKI